MELVKSYISRYRLQYRPLMRQVRMAKPFSPGCILDGKDINKCLENIFFQGTISYILRCWECFFPKCLICHFLKNDKNISIFFSLLKFKRTNFQADYF